MCRSAAQGYGLHWPELDEDIGVEGLLLGKQSTESAASFERWLQRRKARITPRDRLTRHCSGRGTPRR